MEKNRILFAKYLFCIGLTAFFYYSVNAQIHDSEKQIENMLHYFYKSYLTELLTRIPPNLERHDSIIKIYCTKKLIKELNENDLLDYDPFINAQDIQDDWYNTFVIKKDSLQNNLYMIMLHDNYDNTIKRIKLVIVKEKNKYKIDSVIWCPDIKNK